eukprot:CAMPEP_0206459858 /NCGR_PEP_ID=MMETSP0324_2-20121206/24422_1 /ASSEMBLY_ACC=CAM_ASM_000836 /TAXON_ID=2866 /ORGANISM="Crypthecodinium cohnii, Strain Seligo" /LENGTH=481 /DNA_ID=CAMNT_0053931481 /DNA_START=216 /DNA_END=1662 /DNA_ORIENTATION=+
MAVSNGMSVRTDIPGLMSLPELVETIGFGKSQVCILILACGPFFAEGLELLLVSLLTPSISENLRVDGPSGGVMLCLVLCGACLGNVLSGPVSDLIGRQPPIIVGYATVIVFSILSSFMNSLTSIGVIRFFVGLGFGIGQPAALVLLSEVVPKSYSLASVVATPFAVGLGALVAVTIVTIDDAWLKDIPTLEWRLLLRCSALPLGVLGFLSIFLLPESPSYLAATGDFAMSRDILKQMAEGNGKAGVPVLFRVPESPRKSLQMPIETAFHWNFRVVEVPEPPHFVHCDHGAELCALRLRLCSATKLGCGLGKKLDWLDSVGDPHPLPRDNMYGPRRRDLLPLANYPKEGDRWIFALAIFSTLLFEISKSHVQSLPWFLVLSCMGIWCAPAFCILLLVQASVEQYPRLTSTTITSLCFFFGRLGAIVAPVLCDAIVNQARSTSSFFELVVGLELAVTFSFLALDLSVNPAVDSNHDAKEIDA